MWRVGDKPSTVQTTAVDIDNDTVTEHSNVHVGELHWETDPTDETAYQNTSLTIEVDYLAGYNPANMTINPGYSVLDATEDNYALYGIGLNFTLSDRLTQSDLRQTCRVTASPIPGGNWIDTGTGQIVSTRSSGFADGEIFGATACIQPGNFNVWETDLVEDAYHDNESTMHSFWASNYSTDAPLYQPHDVVGTNFIPRDVGGMEGHTGSPSQVAIIDGVFVTPHGTVMFNDNVGSAEFRHKIFMEEIGHGLGAGYADDKGFQIGECYSGGTCYGVDEIGGQYTGGGGDPTNETVTTANFPNGWPIMGDAEYFSHNRTAFSVEELLTIDFEDIPSKDD